MKIRVLVPMLALATASCVGGGGAPPAAGPAGGGAAPDDDAALRVPPWTAEQAAEGGTTYANAQAGVRFPAQVQGIDRKKIVVYSREGPDAGFHYQGALEMNGGRCNATISVYVYPAKEDDAVHFDGVVAAITTKNPEARAASGLVDLTPAYGGPVRQATLSNQVNGVAVDEMVSLSRRGPWFVKFRTTTGPAGLAACKLGLLAFVASVQEPRTPAFSTSP
jgi:hypothetical protein